MCQVSELGSYANIHETADIIIDRVSVAYAAHAQDTVGRLFVRKIIDATIKGESSIKFYRRSDVVISHTGIINPISIIGIKRRHTIGFMLRFPISDGLAANKAQFITRFELFEGKMGRES